ncbi:PREDICTED: putative golgin subfamily A member 6B [Cercocebus atys]|uniref:putative golgin subfamily A member 6B n=1 Tax=Cercocebus atys TaxID=9531 RepID=UPI0005F3BCBE|nr:PREDICTED: putative golgin subfamily A member 6B [Cercocebus atys]
MDLPREKVDGKQQVEKLELGFIQLSGATESMREYITVYESQGAVPNTRHQEEEASRLAQNEEEMKVKLLELQDMVLPVVGDHEGHDKFLPAAQNPVNEPAPGAPASQELGAVEEQSDFQDSVEPAPGQARKGSPCDNPTAQKILQLLPVMQDTQEAESLHSWTVMFVIEEPEASGAGLFGGGLMASLLSPKQLFPQRSSRLLIQRQLRRSAGCPTGSLQAEFIALHPSDQSRLHSTRAI